MKSKKLITAFLGLLFTISLSAQNAIVEGYVYEINNQGYIKNVNIDILNSSTSEKVAEAKTNQEGYFSVSVPMNKNYKLVGTKNHFFHKEQTVTTRGLKEGAKVFVKLEMERKPGYVFDVTLAEPRDKLDTQVDAIEGARIEVYNNTTGRQELELNDYPLPNFKVTFVKGNHYTVMIRKDGYFTKRLEAYVDVEGCILCFEGIGSMEPNVTDVLTNDNSLGTFLSNVEMEPVVINKAYRIENIYYDFDQWYIRSDAAVELDNLIGVLKDNPQLIIELGSHTDARGKDQYNLTLSEKRAKAAVDYIIDKGGIYAGRISSKGYGESELVNECSNGVKCSEEKHQDNRRTEFKVTGLSGEDPLENKTLKQIIEEKKLLDEVINQTPVKGKN